MKKMVSNGIRMIEERFEFREINEGTIVPKIYDNEKQVYANFFECCEWLNRLHKENERLHDEVFRLRTELALERTEKKEHWDSVYDFQKKIEKW